MTAGNIRRFRPFLSLAAILAFPLGLAAQELPPAAEILRRLDAQEVSAGSHATGTITVTDRYGRKVSSYESWGSGDEKSLIVFTAGEEKGQRILRNGDVIYVSWPEADKPVRIQGSALRDSVAGSDLSYEDMAGEKGMASRFDAAVAGRENLGGRDCVILELTARKDGLAYPFQKIWVDTKDWTGVKQERYSRNRRLLKTQEVLETRKVGKRTVPVALRLVDHLKGKSETLFRMDTLEMDISVPASTFRLEELGW